MVNNPHILQIQMQWYVCDYSAVCKQTSICFEMLSTRQKAKIKSTEVQNKNIYNIYWNYFCV